MKNQLIATLTLAIALGFSGTFAFADDNGTPSAQEHEQHHADDQVKNKAKDSGMMGSMNMDEMMGTMHECMSKNKNSKMCKQECMDKCQENMSKDECKKMMTQMKKQKTADKK